MDRPTALRALEASRDTPPAPRQAPPDRWTAAVVRTVCADPAAAAALGARTDLDRATRTALVQWAGALLMEHAARPDRMEPPSAAVGPLALLLAAAAREEPALTPSTLADAVGRAFTAVPPAQRDALRALLFTLGNTPTTPSETLLAILPWLGVGSAAFQAVADHPRASAALLHAVLDRYEAAHVRMTSTGPAPRTPHASHVLAVRAASLLRQPALYCDPTLLERVVHCGVLRPALLAQRVHEIPRPLGLAALLGTGARLTPAHVVSLLEPDASLVGGYWRPTAERLFAAVLCHEALPWLLALPSAPLRERVLLAVGTALPDLPPACAE